MSNEIDTMNQMIVVEKTVGMIFTIEQTMEFLIELKIQPDEEIKKALNPLIDIMRFWIDGK